MTDFSDAEDKKLVQLVATAEVAGGMISGASIAKGMRSRKKTTKQLQMRLKTLKNRLGPNVQEFPAWYFAPIKTKKVVARAPRLLCIKPMGHVAPSDQERNAIEVVDRGKVTSPSKTRTHALLLAFEDDEDEDERDERNEVPCHDAEDAPPSVRETLSPACRNNTNLLPAVDDIRDMVGMATALKRRQKPRRQQTQARQQETQGESPTSESNLLCAFDAAIQQQQVPIMTPQEAHSAAHEVFMIVTPADVHQRA